VQLKFIVHCFFRVSGLVLRCKVTAPNPAFKRDCRKARQPLNFTLGAMRIMQIFSVSQVVDFAAGFVASSVLVASKFVAELLLFPVRLFSRAVSFGVSRSSLLRSLLHRASPVSSFGSFSPFYLQHSVARSASNPALKRDAAEARRPLAPR
jgi:hypothetical protein